MEQEIDKLPCSDKMTFLTKKEAESAALAADWQHGSSLKAYKCQDCKHWHLSSN